MFIQVPIAVSPSVKKYIAHRHSVDPFVLSRTNAYGIFLHNCLVRLKEHPAVVYEKLNEKVYHDKLTLALSEDQFSRHGWFIHPKKQYDFNRMVEMMLDHEFQFFVDTAVNFGHKKIYQAFYDFREKFDLTEDDLTLKTMEKRYERYRKALSI